MDSGWTTIESDPGVFTELIATIGVKGVQVEELYTLDNETFENLAPVHGLIFLFKWTKETQRPENASCAADYPNIYFANQVINNACATQAIISILMNSPDIDIGPHLSDFKELTREFPADMKGEALGNSDVIREAHNSFARAEPFVMEGFKDKDDDAYHFTAYIPIDGHLYELDGLQKGPTHLGKLDSDRWWEQMIPVIQERIQRYSENEIHFNLLAVVKSRKEILLQKAASLLALREHLIPILAAGGDNTTFPDIPCALASISPKPLTEAEKGLWTQKSAAEVLSKLRDLSSELQLIPGQIATEDLKTERYKKENVRRRTNYIPCIVELLKSLASKGLLGSLIEKSAPATKTRHEREKLLEQQKHAK